MYAITRTIKAVAVLASLTCTAAFAQPKIKFSKTEHDFGKISDAQPVTFTFEFVNEGNQPLIVTNAAPSCGCTTPEWTREPVLPGKTGLIKAQYNPVGRGTGPFTKTISVTTNGDPANAVLTIRGEAVAGSSAAASEIRPVEYLQYFPYNQKTLVLGDDKFKSFVDEVAEVIARKGKVSIAMESSSSKVPTKKYKDNNKLATDRALEARSKLTEVLIARGITQDRFVMETARTLVQGPDYKKDPENMKMYDQFQYIKIAAR